MNNKKFLIAYFSCSGVTQKVAQALATATGGNLYEIQPEKPYAKADLDWMDKNSRSTIEMHDLSYRPAIASQMPHMEDYDVVFVGFPIWWYIAPTIINTFLESYDFAGKTIVIFATSGGSGFGKTAENLKGSVSGDTIIKEGKVLKGRWSKEDITALTESFL